MNLRKYSLLGFSPFCFNDNCTYVKHVDKNIHNYRIQFFIIFIFFLVLHVSYMLFYSMFKFNFEFHRISICDIFGLFWNKCVKQMEYS